MSPSFIAAVVVALTSVPLIVIVELEPFAIVLLTFIVASTVLALLASACFDNKTAPNESVFACPSVTVVAVVPTKPN